MVDSHKDRERYDKTFRSFVDAMSMLENEVGLVVEKTGIDTAALSRLLDVAATVSREILGPLTAALGLAEASALERLASDVRSLLESASRQRREQADTAARVDRLAAAVETLEQATRTVAGLQGRTRVRMGALGERGSGLERALERRGRVLEEVRELRARVDRLEAATAPEHSEASTPRSRRRPEETRRGRAAGRPRPSDATSTS